MQSQLPGVGGVRGGRSAIPLRPAVDPASPVARLKLSAVEGRSTKLERTETSERSERASEVET